LKISLNAHDPKKIREKTESLDDRFEIMQKQISKDKIVFHAINSIHNEICSRTIGRDKKPPKKHLESSKGFLTKLVE